MSTLDLAALQKFALMLLLGQKVPSSKINDNIKMLENILSKYNISIKRDFDENFFAISKTKSIPSSFIGQVNAAKLEGYNKIFDLLSQNQGKIPTSMVSKKYTPIIQEMMKNSWINFHEGIYQIHPKGFHDFSSYLSQKFPDEIAECKYCLSLDFSLIKCRNCENRMHLKCASSTSDSTHKCDEC